VLRLAALSKAFEMWDHPTNYRIEGHESGTLKVKKEIPDQKWLLRINYQ